MIPRPRPERFRLRRTMMFMNAQKPGLIKDAYIYGCDSIMLDLEDAVAENPPLAGGYPGVCGRRSRRHPHRQV